MEKLTDQVSCLIQFNYFKQKKKKKREKVVAGWGGVNSSELKSQCYCQFKFSELFCLSLDAEWNLTL